MFENYFVPRRPQSNRLDGGGWAVCPFLFFFFFFFLISGHERSERKGPSIPPGHTRASCYIFVVVVLSAALFLQIWEGRRAAFDLLLLFLVD
jgi:hypothetical protein